MQPSIAATLRSWNGRFKLKNDPRLVPPVLNLLLRYLSVLELDRSAAECVAVALEEALLNSIHHGNLEVSSDLRRDDYDAYLRMIEARQSEPPYCERRVWLTADYNRQRAVFVVRDEGNGFQPNQVPNPLAPDNLEQVGGRGILLMREFMDDVSYNERGNEVQLVKRSGLRL